MIDRRIFAMMSRSLTLSFVRSAVGSALFRSRLLTFVLSGAGAVFSWAEAKPAPPRQIPSVSAPAMQNDLRGILLLEIHRQQEPRRSTELHSAAASVAAETPAGAGPGTRGRGGESEGA